jgi:HK97 family phage major capsid protein
MNHAEQRASLISQAQALLNKPYFTKESKAKFDSLMAMADALGLDGDNFRRARAGALVSEHVVEPAEAEFRKFVRTGGELRTYNALNVVTGSQGGLFVPNAWKAQYQAKLVSSSGLLRAGATVVDDVAGRPYLSFYSDDSANEAEILAENTQLNDAASPANPVISSTTSGTVKYATSTLVSTELLQDSAFDIDSFLQGLFGVRVARKYNNIASVDGTAGIIPALTVGATSTAPTAIALADLISLKQSIDPAYREADSQPVWMMHPNVVDYLRGALDTAYKAELSSGKLMGYAVSENVDMTSSVTAGALSIVFGSVKRAVLVQSAPVILVRSEEKYAEFGKVYFALFHRIGQKLTDANAVAVLKQHA